MPEQWWRDDERLLAELGEAVRGAQQVPERFVEVGRAAFAWRDVDAELAELRDDPADALLAGTRAEAAPLRTFTFEASELTIEVEVTDDALLGQLSPPGPGAVELHGRDGSVREVAGDEVGWFVISPVPAGLCRLRVRTADGAAVLTQWFTL